MYECVTMKFYARVCVTYWSCVRDWRAGLDADTQRMIIALYCEGQTLVEVADATFVAVSTVRRVLTTHGIPRRGHGRPGTTLTMEELLETGELYATGMSLAEVGRVMGHSRRGIALRLQRLGSKPRTKSQGQKLSWKRRKSAVEQ
jgi:DNA-binding CsgD family transcriptional regulator